MATNKTQAPASKSWMKILGIVLLLGLALGFAKNAIARNGVEQVCRKITGLQLKIRNLNLSLLKGMLDAKGIALYNPRGFQDRVMIDISELYGDVDVPSILQGKPHVEELRLDLREFVIVKNKDGKLNLDALKPASKAKADKETEPQKKEEAVKKATPQIRIDKLVLKVGKVVYKDYSAGGEPSVQEFNVNLNETHENITNINALVPLLVSRAVMNTTIASLANLDMQSLVQQYGLNGADLKTVGLEQFGGFLEKAGAGGAGAAAGLKSLFGDLIKKEE